MFSAAMAFAAVGCHDQTKKSDDSSPKPAPLARAHYELTTAYLSPTANAAVGVSSGDNNGFDTNAINAYASGGGVAVDTDSGQSGGGKSNNNCTSIYADKHKFTSYSIPTVVAAGSSIQGIEVRLDLAVDSLTDSPFTCVSLSWDNGTNWTSPLSLALTATAQTTYTFGGATEDWGHTWTTDQLSDANFIVRVTNGDMTTGSSVRDFSLDWIPIKVSSTPPGFTVSTVSGNTTEAGGSAMLTVALDTPPSADVTIAVSSSDIGEGTVGPASLTFTSANWSTPQIVSIAGVDDFIDDGDISYNIVLAAAVSADLNYNGLDPADRTLSNIDNDTAGITVSAVTGNTNEAGVGATLTVVLNSEPTADVTIAASSSDVTEGSVLPASLTFTSADWSTPQTVTATGVDDFVDDGDISYSIVLGAAASADASYNGMDPVDRTLSNIDNDTAGITVSAVSGNTTEGGGTATLTVALDSEPTANVTIAVSSSNVAEGTVAPAGLTFTSGNWSTPQTVTATGVNDFVDDGDISYTIVLGAAASADANYNAVDPADRTLSNVDNDAVGFTVSAVSGNTTEAGGTATLTVVLTSQPTADVTVAVSSTNTAEGTVSPASLTFTAGNWSAPQTVTATGVNDFVDDGDISYTIVLGAATSADGNYNGLNPTDRSLSNIDNDTAGINVSAVSGNTTEAGVTATLTVVLGTQPTANVVIAVSSSNAGEGTVSPVSLTFTSGNWSTPQTVTATGVDDYVDDGNISYSIVLGAATSVDPLYNGVDPADRTLSNTDNDTAGLVVDPLVGSTSETGAQLAFTVVLTSSPTANVTVNASSSDVGEGTLSPASLTFTPANWNLVQTFTVTGEDDLIQDGNAAYSIVLAPAVSTDPKYNGVDPPDVSLTNLDNDIPGIFVGPTTGVTAETGSTMQFTVVLNSVPAANVTIPVSSTNPAEGTVSAASLTFTPANWNTPQTVTVTGVDDFVDDGDIAYSAVLGAATSADPGYNGLDPTDVSLTNSDNETAGFQVVPVVGLSTSEAESPATFTVRLTSQPLADVTVNLTSDNIAEGTVLPASITFTAITWSVPVTVTVTGVDDGLVDGPQPFNVIVGAALSADPLYSGVDPPDVAVTNYPVNKAPSFTMGADQTVLEDAPAVTVAGWASSILAGPPEDAAQIVSFVVTNNNAHLFAVAPAISGAGTLTFTPAQDANGFATVTVKAKDDGGVVGGGVDESAVRTFKITVTAVNDPPIADAISVTTPEETPRVITLKGRDPVENSPVIYSIVTPPKKGTFKQLKEVLTYTPKKDQFGTDTLLYRVSDGKAFSAPAMVTITLVGVNDAPVVAAKAVVVQEDTPVVIALTASDVDGDVLTYTIVTPPTIGSLSPAAASITYTPDPEASGADSFQFKVNDGTVDSAVATVTLTIKPVNDPPTTANQAITLNEDTPTPVVLTGVDVEGSPLTYLTVIPPTHGTLTGTAPNLTYTPAANYNGPDNFVFKVKDGALFSAPATVTFTIDPVDDIPVANAKSVTTPEETPLAITLSGTELDGEALIYATVPPANGTLVGAGANWTYTPGLDYAGPDSFTFTVDDGTTVSAPATVTITVTPVNDAPVADPQAISLAEDTPTPLTLTGSDIDGNPLTYFIVTYPANGTLAGTAQNRTYTPAANFTGIDTFEFKVKDAALFSAPVLVTLTVTAVNDAPVASAKSVTTPEDTPIDIALPATDVEGNPLTYFLDGLPTKGTLSAPAATVTYTPDPNQTGTDTFTFKVNDGTVDSNLATVTVILTAVNDAPVATAQAVSTNEDTAKAITLAGTDVEGSVLTHSIVLPPVHGTLTGAPPNVTYTPFANYNGPDSFQFKSKDAALFSAPATVTITVDPVDDPGPDPLPTSFTLTTSEDVPIAVTLIGSDVAGVAPTFFQMVAVPLNGTLAGVEPDLTYTPNLNWAGTETLTYQVSMDGVTWSAVGTITLNVASVNDLPVAQADALTTDEDLPLAVLLVGSDPVEGSPLTYRIVTAPAHGTLTGTAPNMTYTPTANYSGPDEFVFVVKDGVNDSPEATTTITVNPINDVPTAAALAITTLEDTPKAGIVTATDLDGDPLTWTVMFTPTNGTLGGVLPNFTYTPNADYNGADSFTYYVNDGTIDSDPVTVTITVTAANDAPVALAQAVITAEDATTPVVLTGTDTEGSALSFTIVTQPVNGKVTGTPPNLTYAPNANYSGPDSLVFKVKDGLLFSAPATVTITVNAVDDVPVATAQAVTTPEDTPKAITLAGTDVEGSAITFAVAVGPVSGSLSGVAPNLVYTPDADFNGSDSFTFTATADAVTSAPATVSITVVAGNDAPVATAQVVEAVEDVVQAITLSGTDTEGSTLSYVLATKPAWGTLTGTPPNVSYKPALNFFGPDSFTFKVKDGALLSAPATVFINVTPVNDTPVAKSQLLVTASEDVPKAITLAGTDADGDALTYAVLVGPLNGSLAGVPPNLTYTGNLNFSGTDSFTFTASDASLTSAPATVSIKISPVNDVPTAFDQAVITDEDTAKAIVLSGNDPVEASVLSYFIITRPVNGTLIGSGQNVSYKPGLNFVGTDSFTFRVRDGKDYSNVATVSITVTPVADLTPVATPLVLKTLEDTPISFNLIGSDAGGVAPTFKIVTLPTKGRITGSGAARVYTPNANVFGSDFFTYSVSSDGVTSSVPAKVAITITLVDDPPAVTDQALATDEDTSIDITLLAIDVEGKPLSYEVVVPPAHGTLSGLVPNLSYAPHPNYSGPDFFLYRAKDGVVFSALAKVSITVNPVDDSGPQADEQSVSTLEDAPVAITLTGSDTVGVPAAFFEIVTPPAKGTLAGVPPNVTYTPDLHFVGLDSFTFRSSSDGVFFSAPATVSISVNYVDFAPVANDQAVVVVEDTQTAITLTGSDVEGATLRYTVVTKPTHGVLLGAAAAWKYKPALNYTGADSFTFKVKDAKLESALGTVSITVTNVNDAPAGTAQLLTILKNLPAPVTLSGTDIDGDALTYAVASAPAHGSLAGVPPALTYTPDAAWTGTDYFTFTANDGALTSTEVGVMIQVVDSLAHPLSTAVLPGVSTPALRQISVPLLGSREVAPPPAPGAVLLGVAHDPAWPGADYHFEVYLDADRQNPVFELIARGSEQRTEVWLDDVLTDDGEDDDDLQNPFNVNLIGGERYFWRVRPEKGAEAGAWRESTFVYQTASADEPVAPSESAADLWSVVEDRSAAAGALSTPSAVGCSMAPGTGSGGGAAALLLVILAGLLGRSARRRK